MKIRKGIAIIFGGILSIGAMLTIGYFTPTKWGDRATVDCQYKVCVAMFGIHTNIIVPIQNDVFDWRNYLALNLTNQQYIGFGLGERTWYMNPPTRLEDILSQGIRALFFPNPSVLRMHKHERFPEHYEIECVGVGKLDYLALMQFIKSSFQRSQQGDKIQIVYNPNSGKAFYEATGSYSLVRNSNHWTAEGLNIANVNTPLWIRFSTAIMHHLEGTC
ncbi:MAG TPA: hypothetical protein DCE56_23375 [Cyanobacteria bacterium UBA8553]|nr:hypothetical protein [Cyanobacteria bacterium UBA8553]HAJ61674.1 hypothetical protein [Cyanobacteria bacterium UBA8543]